MPTTTRAHQRTPLSSINTTEDLRSWTAETSRTERREQILELGAEELTALWRATGDNAMSDLLAALDAPSAADVVQRFSRATAGQLLAWMAEPNIADVLRVLPDETSESLRSALPAQLREDVELLLKWPAGAAGANMTPSLLWLPGSMSAREAVDALRIHARDAEATTYVYVLDEQSVLLGVFSFRELITADPDALLAEAATSVTIVVSPARDREVAAADLHEHELTALPVVEEGVLRGVITAHRAAEITAAETTEDFRRMSSTGDLTASVKDASIWLLYRSRVVWLVMLVFGNLFSGAGIAYFEDVIESVVALVFFLPLLIDSGGNAGSQSATLMVRALATGEVQVRDWLRMLGKEAAVALLLSVSMAIAVSLIGIVRGGPEVALVVSLTMIAVVILGSVVGMLLPFAMTKLHLDPANSSTPLITTICDSIGVLVYFFIASQLLL